MSAFDGILDKSPRFFVLGVLASLLFNVGTNNQQSTINNQQSTINNQQHK
jgi:hypothetical protein